MFKKLQTAKPQALERDSDLLEISFPYLPPAIFQTIKLNSLRLKLQQKQLDQKSMLQLN